MAPKAICGRDGWMGRKSLVRAKLRAPSVLIIVKVICGRANPLLLAVFS